MGLGLLNILKSILAIQLKLDLFTLINLILSVWLVHRCREVHRHVLIDFGVRVC